MNFSFTDTLTNNLRCLRDGARNGGGLSILVRYMRHILRLRQTLEMRTRRDMRQLRDPRDVRYSREPRHFTARDASCWLQRLASRAEEVG